MNPIRAIRERRHDRQVERDVESLVAMGEHMETLICHYERITGESIPRYPTMAETGMRFMDERPDAMRVLLDNGVPPEELRYSKRR